VDVSPTASDEARLRLALAVAELGVWDWDVVTGELEWDERVAELHGVDPHTFDGRLESFLARVHPDDLAGLQEAIQAALAARSRFLHEFRVLRPDGTTAWVQSRGQVHAEGTVPVRMLGVSADTTVLRTARERAGRTLQHVSDGVVVFDANWRVVFVNAQAARLVQRDVQGLVGRVLWEEFPEAADTVFAEVYHRAMRTQRPEELEAYYGPLEGWFEVRVFPAPDGLTVYFRNVDERRAAEEERARLIRQLTASLNHSEQLLTLSRTLAATLTLEEVADAVTTHTRAALGSLFAGVALLDEDRETLRYVSMSPLPDDVVRAWTEFPLDMAVPAADTVRRGGSLMFPDRAAIVAVYPHIAEDLERAGTQGMANVALVASGRTIGALTVTWAEPHTCDEEETRFLDTLAGQCAQAIERSRLFTRQQGVAETLQRAILPERLPTVPGVALAACYEAAGHGVDVGGDWYDAFELPGGLLALVVGDVAGHGIPAAAVMGQLRNAGRAYALDGHGPGAVVTRLNRLLCHSARSTCATVVCATLDPATGALRWSSAGHPPPVLVDAGSARLLERVHGPLLGADPAAGFEESALDLAEGATLLLYTDGLVEHRSRGIGAGLDELLGVVAAASTSDLDGFCDEVVAGVLPQLRREDDVCLLAVTRRAS